MGKNFETQNTSKNVALLSLTALGVVYGDIGTSPLYALRECFSGEHALEFSPVNVMGILSLVFWSLVIIISLKYMLILMRADNRGEGGILALLALVTQQAPTIGKQRMAILTVLGIGGSALLFGDAVITPVITTLGALEGMKLVTPVFEPYVVPLTVVILVGLFILQRQGTANIGILFGPVILIWFICLAILGTVQIFEHPHVLLALNPAYAIEFFRFNGTTGFMVLGSVFLCVTGGEALYADMGHFGRKPIQLAWFYVALPALVLNYFGQGAFLLTHPGKIENPFFQIAPEWSLIPLVILSAATAVIASQAVISGVFSLTRMAVQLGYCPRVNIIHTSHKEIGQIYIPTLNWALMVMTIWVAVSFKTSSALASAYGVAVTGTMLITTILAYSVARRVFGLSRWISLPVTIFLLIIDGSFTAANLIKISDGGWLPLMTGGMVYFLMSTWFRGRKILARRVARKSVPLQDFLQQIREKNPLRVSGSALFMTGDPKGTPPTLVHNLKHNKVLHEFVAVLTISTQEIPYVSKSDRVTVERLAPDLIKVIAKFGFMETPKIPLILSALEERGHPLALKKTIFFLGRDTILPSRHPGMPIWREKVFAFMARNALRATAFFDIPPDQVIEVGIQVEI